MKEQKRETERLHGRGWLYMHTRTFRCQSRLGIFGLWDVELDANTIFPLKIYVFIHAEDHENGEGRGRLRTRSLFAFSPLLTSYSRADFLHQPSHIVNVNARVSDFLFFSSFFFYTLPPITEGKERECVEHACRI